MSAQRSIYDSKNSSGNNPKVKQPMNEQMGFVHTIEYYWAIERNEVLVYIARWMNLENIMLSKRSQTQKGAYCLSPFI